MGDNVGRGYEDLVRNTNKIDEIMNLKVVDGAWDVGGTGERWHERDTEVVMRIKQTSMFWILDNPANAFPKFKEYCLASNPSQETRLFGPTEAEVSPQETSQRLTDIPGLSTTTELPSKKWMPPKDQKLGSLSVKTLKVPNGVIPGSPEFQTMLREQLADGRPPPQGESLEPEYEENAKKLDIKSIQSSKDPNCLCTTNPIYCGLVSFSMLTDFEAAGISLTNWHNSIRPAAHVYNASQQSSGISRSWPEMDTSIDLHMTALFANQIPLSSYEFYVWFTLALGLPMSSISRTNIHRSNNAAQRSQQSASGIKLNVTEVSDVFRQYFETNFTLEACLLKLDKLMRDPGSRASRKEKEAWKWPLTDMQFLAMLEVNIPRITRLLRFDYITLTKQCAKLLKSMRQQIMLQLGVTYPMRLTDDSVDQTLSLIVMGILEENNIFASSQWGAQGATIGPQLRVAKEEIEKFLGTYKPQDLISNFNILPRPARTPSGLVPNYWNISIRHVALTPPGKLVFFVQPDSHYVHVEGPIQTVEGQTPGHVLNPKSLVTLQTIARLIMKAFVEGMGADGSVPTSAPWTWATNEPKCARRIIKVMTDMGVRQDLMNMTVADADAMAACDKACKDLQENMMGLMGGR